MSQRLYVVHLAAAVEGQQQKCSRCGEVLIDAEGAMSIGGSPMRSWVEGAQVGRSVGTGPTMSYVVDGRELDDDEIECDGAIDAERRLDS